MLSIAVTTLIPELTGLSACALPVTSPTRPSGSVSDAITDRWMSSLAVNPLERTLLKAARALCIPDFSADVPVETHLKTLKAAILVVVMAPMVVLASPRGTMEAIGATTKGAGSDVAQAAVTPPTPDAPPAAVPPAAPAGATPASASPAALVTTKVPSKAEPQDQQGFTIAADLDHWLGTGTFYNASATASRNLGGIPPADEVPLEFPL